MEYHWLNLLPIFRTPYPLVSLECVNHLIASCLSISSIAVSMFGFQNCSSHFNVHANKTNPLVFQPLSHSHHSKETSCITYISVFISSPQPTPICLLPHIIALKQLLKVTMALRLLNPVLLATSQHLPQMITLLNLLSFLTFGKLS